MTFLFLWIIIIQYVFSETSVSCFTRTGSCKRKNKFIALEVFSLANIKSAKKRIQVIETKTLRNKMTKSKIKTLVKKVEAAVAQNDKAAATAALTEAVVAIDKAAAKGIFHKNTAARKVSRLTKAVNKIA